MPRDLNCWSVPLPGHSSGACPQETMAGSMVQDLARPAVFPVPLVMHVRIAAHIEKIDIE